MATIIAPPCMFCGKAAEITLTDAEFAAFQREHFIQDALPHWNVADRELLISGTHPQCWERMFPAEED